MRRPAAIGLSLLATASIVLSVVGAQDACAKEKKGRGESSWTRPGFAGFGVDRIAMLPVATYDADHATEKQVERAVGVALRETGYRWISATGTRNLLRANGADSLLAGLRESLLKVGRADSLEAPRVCAVLRCDALLGVRVDQWEQREVEWNQSGKSSTTVRLSAALVDSTGALLWSTSGNETGEGPYHSPESGPPGVTQTGIHRGPATGQGSAPGYLEVLEPILERWAKAFPAGKAGASSAPGGGDDPATSGAPDR